MLIKGEKYACEACVRGHRVSNCQHADRPLQHINKKGRPVSQCTHCRTLRKSRSAHVRCECGEKGHSKGSCTHEGTDLHVEACCCSHGARCSCALKKDHLDTVPESSPEEALPLEAVGASGRRPRALTAQSEGGLTILSNGLHKPAPKNKLAHKCGLPYVVPRANSIPSGFGNRSVDNLPRSSAADILQSDTRISEPLSATSEEQRMIKSEHGSPVIKPPSNFDQLNGELAPLDITNMTGDYNLISTMSESELPLFSAGLSATSIDWSLYDGLDFNNDSFGTTSYSQAPSFTGFDFSSIDQPALTTTSTSGEISEVEDFGHLSDTGASGPALLKAQYGSDFDTGNSDFGDMDGYRLSTTSSYVGFSQTQMLANGSSDGIDMETFGKEMSSTSYSNQDMPISFEEDHKSVTTPSHFDDSNAFQFTSTDEDVNESFWMNNYTSTSNSADDVRDIYSEKNAWVQ